MLYAGGMTNTDCPTRAELAREAFEDFLAGRRCPIHAEEVVLAESDDHVTVGCLAIGCEVIPTAVGAF